jgi:hypothetical protein
MPSTLQIDTKVMKLMGAILYGNYSSQILVNEVLTAKIHVAVQLLANLAI